MSAAHGGAEQKRRRCVDTGVNSIVEGKRGVWRRMAGSPRLGGAWTPAAPDSQSTDEESTGPPSLSQLQCSVVLHSYIGVRQAWYSDSVLLDHLLTMRRVSCCAKRRRALAGIRRPPWCPGAADPASRLSPRGPAVGSRARRRPRPGAVRPTHLRAAPVGTAPARGAPVAGPATGGLGALAAQDALWHRALAAALLAPPRRAPSQTSSGIGAALPLPRGTTLDRRRRVLARVWSELVHPRCPAGPGATSASASGSPSTIAQ